MLLLVGCAAPLPPTPTNAGQSPEPTPAVPAASTAWTTITWHPLSEREPAESFGRVVRTGRGFLALSQPIPTETGSRTQLWLSGDGVTWDELPQTAVGADSIVVGVHEVGQLLLALAVAGGNGCDDAASEACFPLRPPLRAWTSADGRSWTLQSEPLNLALAQGEFSINEPSSERAPAGALVAYGSLQGNQYALSRDGTAWSQLTPEGLPPGFVAGDLGSLGGGFVIAGQQETADRPRAVVGWSADGASWESAFLGEEFFAGIAGEGSGGLILSVSTDRTPGGPAWLSSTDGHTWTPIPDFAPLGRWQGQGQGTGLLPNGELASDRERFVAYDTVDGGRAWTSFDGVDWTELAIAGDEPPPARFPGSAAAQLTVTPIGLLWRDDAGNAWLADPR